MIGIIGGSGLDNPEILEESKDVEISTPYGNVLTKQGKIKGKDVILVSRHGRKHETPPTQVNYRANIYALKDCEFIIATTAVGSLKEEIKRGDLVILDQFIDFTKHRKFTFHEKFDDGPKHCPMSDPFDKNLRKKLIKGCEELNLKYHEKGTVVTIEGPRFSTRAESKVFRQWGADVINMSIAPECALANELNVPYAAVAMSTDYDCIFDNLPPVTWEKIVEVFNKNVSKVTKLITYVI